VGRHHAGAHASRDQQGEEAQFDGFCIQVFHDRGVLGLPMVVIVMIRVRIYDTGSKAGGYDKAYEDEADPGGCCLVHTCSFKFH
jgi:hypothetical protein